MKTQLYSMVAAATLAMVSSSAWAEHDDDRHQRDGRGGIPPAAHVPQPQAQTCQSIGELAQEIEQQACDLYYELANPAFRRCSVWTCSTCFSVISPRLRARAPSGMFTDSW